MTSETWLQQITLVLGTWVYLNRAEKGLRTSQRVFLSHLKFSFRGSKTTLETPPAVDGGGEFMFRCDRQGSDSLVHRPKLGRGRCLCPYRATYLDYRPWEVVNIICYKHRQYE